MNLLQPGTQLDGRYEVVRLLGQGGMAAVYQVRHLGLHSTHALKVLNADLSRNDDIRGRFLAEGRIQARLRHPHIVQVTEIVTTPVAGLVMDYIEGPTLGEFCRGRGLEPKLLLEVFLPVLDAVEEAHRHGVVHRDLKPDNIIIGKDSRGRLQPKVTDFGIAKVLVGESAEGKARTQAGARMGTLLYMSPEQIRGAAEVDARTDIFALGAILYEVATGQVAFHASSDYDTMKRIVEGTYEPPERFVGELPPVIAGCIRKALAVEPSERFQDCAAFREALEQALEANPEVPERPSRSYAKTQVGHVAPPSEPVRESAFAATHLSNSGRPAMNTARLEPTPPPPPDLLAPRAPSPPVRAPPSAPPPEQRVASGSTPSPAVALLLGLFCIPGVGQLYNGQVLKGIGLLLLCGLLVGPMDTGMCGLFVVNVLLGMDAYRIASKRRGGKQIGSWEFF
ncbi:serine/threonine-protein kinase [Archangium sp.]|uniref:serine/threonine protein kinase n=1 Tax=Archangium sp. TaxID=1872627 RepID=UPI002EDB1EB7